MSIKSIAFPLFVVALVFIALNFIRPTVLSILEKREMRDSKQAELKAVEGTLANIRSLSDSRSALLAEERGARAIEYLPFASDQDRVLDILNYLAVQAGASIASVTFKETPVPIRPSTTEPMLGDGTALPNPPQPPISQAFTVTVEMTGTYESIKSFMEKVSNANRLHTISVFSIKEKKQEGGTEEAPPVSDGFLEGMFEADFAYLPEETYENAYLHPVFASGTFDTSGLDKLSSMKSDVPSLVEPSVSGRSNPFTP